MKKQGILFFVLRALARQLQRQADFLFRLVETVERPAPRSLPVAHDQTLKTELPLSDAEAVKPSADWLARGGAADEPPAHWLRRIERAMPTLLADRDEVGRSHVAPTIPAANSQQETERIESRQAVALLNESATPAPTQQADMPRPFLAKSAAEEAPHQKQSPAREEVAPTLLPVARPRPPVQPETRLYVIEEQRPSSLSRQNQRETEAALSPAAESREGLLASSQPSMRVYREAAPREETPLARSLPASLAPYTHIAQEAAAASIPPISVDWRGGPQHTQGALLHAQAPANGASALAPSRPTNSPVHDLDRLERQTGRSRRQARGSTFGAGMRQALRKKAGVFPQKTRSLPPWKRACRAASLPPAPPARFPGLARPQTGQSVEVPAPQSANRVSWAGLDALPLMHTNRTTDAMEQRTQGEDGWPCLPDDTPGNARPWRAVYQAWERQQRLDSEQRGEIWNV